MKGRKRSLSQTGGHCRREGDEELSRTLARCLDVDPKASLPFTHGFHAYPARMHPETARRIFESFPGARVLDPFVGSGTTAVEAVRAGRTFTGSDLSQVALEIAWVRSRILPPPECRRVEQEGAVLADRAFEVNERDEFRFPDWALGERAWYDPHTLREICILKLLIDAEEEFLRRAHTCVLSSIVVKLSRQISDSDTRNDIYHRPRPRHAPFRAFRDRCSELTKGLLLLSSDLYKRKVTAPEPVFRREDARAPKPPADLIVTSPPYPGIYNYAAHQARRYPLVGEDAGFVEANEIGARRTQGAGYARDLGTALGSMVAAAPRIVMLIGDGYVSDRPLNVRTLVGELAGTHGARLAASASQKRRDWSGGPPREEHLLLIDRISAGSA